MVVYQNILIFLICLVLPHQYALAEAKSPVDLGKSVTEHIRFEMRFHNLIVRMSNEIERDFDNIPIDQIETRNMDEYLRGKMNKFVDFYEFSSDMPKTKIQRFRHMMTKEIKYTEVWKMLKSLYIGTGTFFKRNGFGLALAILLGYISDFLVLGVATQLGLKTLLFISPITPYGLIYALAPKLGHQIKLRKRLIETLGGVKQYTAYMEQMKLTAKELKMGNPYRLLFPTLNYMAPVKTTADGIEAVVIPKSAQLAGLAQKLGVEVKTLNYNTLLVFMTTQNISNDYIKWVKNNPYMSRWQKVGTIVDNIVNTQDESVILAFKNRFHDSFVKVKKLKYWNQLKSWTKRMHRARSTTEMKKLIRDLPDWISAREILVIWEEIVLPEMANRTDIGYFEYRKLVFETEVLRAKAFSTKSLFDMKFQQEFLEMVGKSLGKVEYTDCKNSPSSVLFYMVKQLSK